jgi:hypothetical protein
MLTYVEAAAEREFRTVVTFAGRLVPKHTVCCLAWLAIAGDTC